jgi:hypothetical protein
MGLGAEDKSIKGKKILLRLCDYLAALGIFYPWGLFLWADYKNDSGPVDLTEKIASLGLLFPLAAAFWFVQRKMADPPGSHPFVDRMLNNRRFAMVAIALYAFALYVARVVLGVLRMRGIIQ